MAGAPHRTGRAVILSGLSDCSDDDLIAEVSRRLTAGRIGLNGLLSSMQIDYERCWIGVCNTINDLSNRDFDHPHVARLRDRVSELAAGATVETRVFAVNTTFYGRPALEDHTPRVA